MTKPLEGIRVLDWTAFQQGPVAGLLLADMGADVIKIEPPQGEPARGLKYQVTRSGFDAPVNFYYQNQNRGKRGIVLNLAVDEAKQVLYKMVESSDVFVTNYRESAAKKLKVDYDTLRKYNEKLIYAYSSSYGPKGPDADKISADFGGQARGGLMSVNQGDDLVPTLIGGGFADEVGGMMTAYGILLAIIARERFGIGQRVDASLLGGQIEVGRLGLFSYLLTGELPAPSIMKAAKNPLMYIYPAGDGKYFATCGLQPDKYWPQFCKVFGVEELEKDPRFENMFVRREHFDELIPRLKEIASTKPRDEWLRLLDGAGVPVAPVNDYADLAKDPQVIANEYIVEVEDPVMGKVKVPGIPVQLSETPGKVEKLAPQLGEHTEEVLMELCGYTWDDLARLREAGVY